MEFSPLGNLPQLVLIDGTGLNALFCIIPFHGFLVGDVNVGFRNNSAPIRHMDEGINQKRAMPGIFSENFTLSWGM
jgi:hypothetical protein